MNLESFKDPDGFVFDYNDNLYRCIYYKSVDYYSKLFKQNFFTKLIDENKIINFTETENIFYDKIDSIKKEDKILNLKKINFFSYPHEWPFEQLKDAAIFHLDFEILLLKENYCLKDASSRNIIFYKNRPIFIDHLSIKEYKDGDYWLGQIQFYNEFLNPLIIKSKCKINYNDWYEANFYGIFSEDLNNILKFHQKLNSSIFFHVVLPAKSKFLINNQLKKLKKNFSKEKYMYILNSLKNFIINLKISTNKDLRWSNYKNFIPYEIEEFNKKKMLVRDFLNNIKLENIVDLGCNDGTFLLLSNKKKNILGYDFDHECINESYIKSKNIEHNAIFFVKNLSKEITQRKKFNITKIDACLSLALIHHLRVTENIPITKIITYILSVAKEGLIEFVDKSDEKFKSILGHKEDTYDDYNMENITNIIKTNQFEIKKIHEVKKDKRYLIHYQKK